MGAHPDKVRGGALSHSICGLGSCTSTAVSHRTEQGLTRQRVRDIPSAERGREERKEREREGGRRRGGVSGCVCESIVVDVIKKYPENQCLCHFM